MKLLISAILFFSASLTFAYEIGERIIVRGPHSGKTIRQVVEAYRVPNSGRTPTRISQQAINDTFSFFDRYYGAERTFTQTSVWPQAGTNFEYISLQGVTKRGPAIWNADHIVILDFSQPSSKKRLHLINLLTGEIESFRSGHGRGSDCEGMACRFEGFMNENSNRSPLGFFVTGQTYNSQQHGPAILLIGLEGRTSTFEGNDRPTTIVIHGAWYVNNGNVGRSNGCVALSDSDMTAARDRMEDGVLFYFYHPSLRGRGINVSGLTNPPQPLVSAVAPDATSSQDDDDSASSSDDN
jgi:hypothetical protein